MGDHARHATVVCSEAVGYRPRRTVARRRAGAGSVGPGVSGERDGDATIPVPGVPRTPIAFGKGSRLAETQRQGSVVAVIEDPADPLIVIAVENGYVTVRLRCGTLCPSIHLGDYVVVEGQRRSEAVLDASDVWVATP